MKALGVVLMVLGGLWAFGGFYNIVANWDPVRTQFTAVAMLVNGIIYVVPGAVVLGVGAILYSVGQRRARSANGPERARSAMSLGSPSKQPAPSPPAKSAIDEMTKKCPECAETIKLEAIVCRYCRYRFDPGEVRKALEERVESASAEVLAKSVSVQRTKSCPSCGASVYAGLTWCQSCWKPITPIEVSEESTAPTATPSPSHAAGQEVSTTTEIRMPPWIMASAPMWSVIVQAPTVGDCMATLKAVLRTHHPDLTEPEIESMCAQPMIPIDSGLSLSEADALMLRLHEMGLLPQRHA